MTDPRTILVAAPLRIIRLSVVVAGLTALLFVFSIATGGARWNMLLYGGVVALSGVQVLRARDLLGYTAPGELRAWMRPLGYALCAVSVPCFAFGVLAVIHLVAASY